MGPSLWKPIIMEPVNLKTKQLKFQFLAFPADSVATPRDRHAVKLTKLASFNLGFKKSRKF